MKFELTPIMKTLLTNSKEVTSFTASDIYLKELLNRPIYRDIVGVKFRRGDLVKTFVLDAPKVGRHSLLEIKYISHMIKDRGVVEVIGRAVFVIDGSRYDTDMFVHFRVENKLPTC